MTIYYHGAHAYLPATLHPNLTTILAMILFL